MTKSKNKNQYDRGIVYSTNPEFQFNDSQNTEPQTLPPPQQNLRVLLDRKLKGGKKATLITGFIGSSADLAALAKQLKNLCAAGGSVTHGEILVQGDFRQKVMDFLLSKGYKVKLSGG
ncbi:MAG: translation initiation factor [Lentimicrobium sp.]|jgi:translation initiation factor 1|nr:translation initiation factor [Lentimicrobium sp.]MDD2527050.1 translation initiation factor [Lentimicrobiaceae bacterium]MDD4597631.1 translation initiation factor [Lentimicrobiaceae bacterium]MDY0026295.1 translation initiation factor [Lentimicrobium sp.]HAH56628.1 translation initiation factor [Bacteroidales bacterium]